MIYIHLTKLAAPSVKWPPTGNITQRKVNIRRKFHVAEFSIWLVQQGMGKFECAVTFRLKDAGDSDGL